MSVILISELVCTYKNPLTHLKLMKNNIKTPESLIIYEWIKQNINQHCDVRHNRN